MTPEEEDLVDEHLEDPLYGCDACLDEVEDYCEAHEK
jgi:hypothetical protein